MTNVAQEAAHEGEICAPGLSLEPSSREEYRVIRGPYLGDVSALCFLPSTPSSYLIAGTGPQVLLYDLVRGDLLLSQQVFDGVRVHGIHVRRESKILAVHGEGRVKVLELQRHEKEDLKLSVLQSLPRFFQWILDVRFLQEKEELAVGLSDNSVAIWSLRNRSIVSRVECSERCLLYSLRLWGSSVETLRVAAGTIFNKVLIWDVEPNRLDHSSVRTVEPLQELLGHEGSIHRISWSEDGLCVASASDDRSARIWTRLSTDSSLFTAGPVLYGHGARLWDCHIADNLLITASEDCTSRIWTRQGHHLATLTGHTGRGIWRCVYDHETSTLVTAGADSAIKVQLLARWNLEAQKSDKQEDLRSSSSDTEILRISLVGPNVLGEGSSTSMDSNSEYVRCLALSGPATLYIATNQGHVYHVALLDTKNQEWTEITHEEISGPIVCMNLLVDAAKDELVAFGNGSGIATAVGIRVTGQKPIVIWQCKWLADHERQLLGVFWVKSLGRRFIFSTDPRGLVRVWLLEAQNSVEGQDPQIQPLLIATCQSPLLSRVVCLDVCPSTELLVCGDQRGNLVSFKFPSSLGDESLESPLLLQSFGVFKGAHGISAVASVSMSSSSNKQDSMITSTGRDGCICKFVITKDQGQAFACTGVEDVTAITVVESVEYRQDKRKCSRRLAAGFIASNFILWDLTQQSELMRVTCGGWRRPHSYAVGDIPEHQCCFAFLKDHVVYVHRNWTSSPVVNVEDSNQISQLPQSLHGQFHGREIHSVHFIPSRNKQHVTKWIATGAEDGAVRISRYDAGGVSKLESCLLLGEHTGGSAVRALTVVQGAQTSVHYEPPFIRNLEVCKTDPVLLLSVGAKEVLTCWLLEWKQDSDSTVTEALSSKWLCSYAPPRSHKLPRKKEKAAKKDDKTADNLLLKEKQSIEESRIATNDDDDLRFLAVTATSIYCPDTGSVVCFVVTASSNATLRLIAMNLNTRNWVEIAILEHHTVPVLALQHVVIPIEGSSSQNAHLVISGATDGSIAVWDITNLVITFTKERLSGVAAGTQLRPRTGRGSQGGRRFRSAKQRQAGLPKEMRKKVDNTATLGEGSVDAVQVDDLTDRTESGEGSVDAAQVDDATDRTESAPFQSSVLLPLHTFAAAHQSGVNCLSAARYRGSEVVVVSGGDDQRLHVEIFKIHSCEPASGDLTEVVETPAGQGDGSILLTPVSEGTVEGAHSSAVKGLWTDGAWVFSTGLDQRLRCWQLDHYKREIFLPLVELSHCIIDVPEAEDLHVEPDPIRNQYNIAVVGRGLQVFNLASNQ